MIAGRYVVFQAKTKGSEEVHVFSLFKVIRVKDRPDR